MAPGKRPPLASLANITAQVTRAPALADISP
jgi:hypothetical protein